MCSLCFGAEANREIMVLWWNMLCNFYHISTEQESNMPGFLEMHYMVTERDEKKWCSLLHVLEQQDRFMGGKQMELLRKKELELTQKMAMGAWRFRSLKWRGFQTSFQALFLVFLFHSDLDYEINDSYLRYTEGLVQPRRSL